MRLQSIFVPDNDRGYPELFCRGGRKNDCRIELSKGEALSFDTYFNSFSYTKYRDYTNIRSISFLCRFIGSAHISLCVYDGAEHIICETDANGGVLLSAELSDLPLTGFLYPRITALTDCAVESGEYSADCVSEKISCCIAICTFKREQYVLKNIEQLKRFKFSLIDRVFVIDNGKTLDCNELSDDFISVLPNKNYGGSGGFTRGMIEAYDGGYSHVILMDDDVEFYPETLEHMTVFVSLLREEYRQSWFSAGMLPLDRPWQQYELGAEWNGNEAVVHKHNYDIRRCDALLDNLINPDVQYGGWWTMLMPVSSMKKGLPFPFFIKFDDAEYGMRKSDNVEILTMNGIAVSHEAFDRKKSFVLDYYNLRNELVVNAVYYKHGAFGAVKRFLYEIAKQLILYRYDNIPLVIRAINDFMGGVDFFLSCDEERLNTDLISSAPMLVPLENIPHWDDTMRCDEHELDKRITPAMALTLGGHLIPPFFLKKEISGFPLSRTGAKDCFRRKALIQYQLGGNNGILTRRSFKKFLKYGFAAVGVSVTLLFNYKRIQHDFLSRKSEITSFGFWKAHLGLNTKTEQ